MAMDRAKKERWVDLERLRELEAAATAGPWENAGVEYINGGGPWPLIVAPSGPLLVVGSENSSTRHWKQSEATAEFIVAFRNAASELLDALDDERLNADGSHYLDRRLQAVEAERDALEGRVRELERCVRRISHLIGEQPGDLNGVALDALGVANDLIRDVPVLRDQDWLGPNDRIPNPHPHSEVLDGG